MMKGSSLLGLAALLSLAAMTAVVGCGKKEDDKVMLAAPASTLTLSKAAPEVKVTSFVIASDGKTTIEMPAPKEHIKAKTTVSAGNLDVDLMNIANTRGEVRIDLTSLTTFTFGNKDKDEAQTEHARTWLEAVVEGKVKEETRWTVFAIRSIDNVSANDVSKVAPMREGNEDIRTVTLTAHGDFLLHGRKSMKDAKLVARFHYAPGAPAEMGPPMSVDIKTAEPLRIVLAEHEVKPRDTFGKVAQGSFHLLGTKVADTADVSLDIRATSAATK
jgi:hypothetical protein